jgi:hypothetical protein
VPPIYGFIEVVRSFGEWRANHRSPLRLVLYIQSDVELCLTSGRVDIPELLASRMIRFWVVVEVKEGQEPVRRAMYCFPSKSIRDVLKEVGVPTSSDTWSVSICPSPQKKFSKKQITHNMLDQTIVEFGIAFGSVLILSN